MLFSEYQSGTKKTWNPEPIIDPKDFQLLAAMSGLGEAGESMELIKKHVFHGIPADRDKVKKELGDLLYYMTRIADFFDITLEEVAQANHDKLAARYPNGFVKGGGIR